MSLRPLCSALAVVALLCAAWRLASSSDGAPAAEAPTSPPVAVPRGTEPPSASVGASAVPYAPPAALDDDASFDDPDRPELWPDPAVRPLIARVVDADGRPLGGIPVCVLSGRGAGGLLCGPRHTRKNGEARFPIDVALEQEGDVVVAARAVPGAAAWNLVAVALDRAAETVLRVDRGLTAAVRLFDVDGAPYAGPARVRKVLAEEERPETGERGAALTEAFRETTPRALRDGSAYLLHGLRPAEAFTLLAAAPDREPAFADHAAPESGPDPFALETRLGPRHAFVALEAAPPDGAPAGLSFTLRDTGGPDLVAAGADDRPTQASPRFRHPVPAGVGSVLRVDAYAGDGPFAAAEVEVPPLQPGETFEAGRLPLEPLRAVVAGRVTDADDRPVAGATVEALPRRGPPLAGTADGTGAFSLRGLPGRGPYQIAAHAEGRVAALAADVPEGAADVRFALEAAGAVEGRVRAPAGVDAARLRVRAVRADRGPVATVVEAGGAFRLTGLPAGVYVLVIDGPGVETLRVGDVVVAAGETNREDRLQRLSPRLSPRGEP